MALLKRQHTVHMYFVPWNSFKRATYISDEDEGDWFFGYTIAVLRDNDHYFYARTTSV